MVNGQMFRAAKLRPMLAVLFVQGLLLTPASAVEDDFQSTAEYTGLAVAIDRQAPNSPRTRARKTQEAWVRMSYVVTADGRAIDPLVVDSSGGIDFENEVRAVMASWRFEESITGAELPYNIVDTRFTIRGKGNGITRKYSRYARHIMRNLQSGNTAKARGVADEAMRIGGWNLYESTILWLMLGRVEGAEGDKIEKLEMYQRGLQTSDEYSLQNSARVDLLEDIFELQYEFGQYAAALTTYETLENVRGSKLAEKRLAENMSEIEAALANQEVVSARATITTPCNCEEGEPLWTYVPVRRTFSFSNVDGNVERFEARCETQRISGAIDTESTWTLEPGWGSCRIFVLGDDGATFDFVEHMHDADRDAANATTVAKNYVLDSRSRRQ